MNLEPGDKVSYINEKLNGTVKYRIDKRQVMLELEDGFDMPANVSELILVKKLNESQTDSVSAPPSTLDTGLEEAVFLAFVLGEKKYGEARVQTLLMNNTPYHLVYLLFDIYSKSFERFNKGDIAPFTTSELSNFSFAEIESHKAWQCRFFYFNESMQKLPEPLVFDYKLKPANLLKSEELIPALGKPGFMVKILLSIAVKTEVEPQQKIEKIAPPTEIIDLHAEYILGEKVKDKQGLLDMQLLYLRNNLEKGMAAGMERMTFIHGIGNGILKQNLLNILKEYKEVLRWEEADHKKYGYGAMTVYFKTR